jgi:hypothetical protein
MNDAELNKRFDALEAYIEVLAKTVSDQTLQLLIARAHQQAHLGLLRRVLVQRGDTPGMVNQRLKAAYQEALRLYQDQFEAFGKDGDAAKLLDYTPLSDDIREN